MEICAPVEKSTGAKAAASRSSHSPSQWTVEPSQRAFQRAARVGGMIPVGWTPLRKGATKFRGRVGALLHSLDSPTLRMTR